MSLRKCIMEALEQEPEIELSNRLDDAGFEEKQSAGVLKFEHSGNYKHVITYYAADAILVYEVFKKDKCIEKQTYDIFDNMNINKIINNILDKVERME